MWEGYRPKVLLYTLDELIYFNDQVKCHMRINEKFVVAYEILSLTALHCMEHWGWVEKSGMPDAILLVNLIDTCHLEYLTWVVYDGVLLVGSSPELLGECQWCTVLAGIFKHIYKAATKQHIAHPIPWYHGTASREMKWCVKNKDKMPHIMDMMMDVDPGDRGQGVAPGIILRHPAKRGGPDTPSVPHPTHLC